MLILTRKFGEKFFIGNDIVITILGVKKNQIKIGIDAPKSILINREEIHNKKLNLNK